MDQYTHTHTHTHRWTSFPPGMESPFFLPSPVCVREKERRESEETERKKERKKKKRKNELPSPV